MRMQFDLVDGGATTVVELFFGDDRKNAMIFQLQIILVIAEGVRAEGELFLKERVPELRVTGIDRKMRWFRQKRKVRIA